MKTSLARFTLRFWGTLAAWSALCALVSQFHFPHVLFICEHVETLYHGLADDGAVSRFMRTIVAVVWTIGAAALTAGAQMFGGAGDGRET